MGNVIVVLEGLGVPGGMEGKEGTEGLEDQGAWVVWAQGAGGPGVMEPLGGLEALLQKPNYLTNNKSFCNACRMEACYLMLTAHAG